MIGFVLGRTSPSGRRTGVSSDFVRVARYLLYGDRSREHGRRAIWTSTRNVDTDDLEDAARRMAAHAATNRRVQGPVYHFGASLAPGEGLNEQQWRYVAERLLGGLSEHRSNRLHDPRHHQAVLAIHRQNEREHLHVALNRVGPERDVWVASWDYSKLLREVRLLEQELGLVPTRGYYGTARGDFRGRSGPTYGERRQFAETGIKAWGHQLLDDRGDALRSHLRSARSWIELEQRLDGLGLKLQASGVGRVLIADGLERHLIKLSRIDRASSGPSLEKRFGRSYEEWRAEQVRALGSLREKLERAIADPQALLPRERVAARTAGDQARISSEAARFGALVALAYEDGYRAEGAVAGEAKEHRGNLWSALWSLQSEPGRFGHVVNRDALLVAIAAGQELERTRLRALTHEFWSEVARGSGSEPAARKTLQGALRSMGPRQALAVLRDRASTLFPVVDREAVQRAADVARDLERPWTARAFWRAIANAYGNEQVEVQGQIRNSLGGHGLLNTLEMLRTEPERFGAVRDADALAVAIARGRDLHRQPERDRELLHLPSLGLSAGRTARAALRGFAALHALSQGREATAAAPRLVAAAPELAASLARLAPAGRSLGGSLRVSLRSLESLSATAQEGVEPLHSARQILGLAQAVGARALALALPAETLAALNIAVKPLALGLTLGAYVLRTLSQAQEQGRGIEI